MDHPGPGRANRTAEGYLRPHAAVCARRRAISCTRCHSASSRTGSDATVPATQTSNPPPPVPPRVSRDLEHEGYVKMPGRTRGETRALRNASRDYAHRHGIPLDHAAMVSMLAEGKATNNEIVRQHGASKDSPGSADRACIGPTYTQQCVRRGEVAPCRHMATLHAPGIQWSFPGRYLRAGAGLAISRERDRCLVGVHVERR